MAKNQTVSVIIPFYNSEAYLNRAIESVVNQTYTDWEIILIDDKSTDNSLKIAKKWVSKNKQIKLIVNKNNLGAAISRNIGI
ncbi:MAG: glycosyltransferase family 2 protein [Candidatus Saccharibacteria bacterium]|nr:glycosyltransferase family 2 protein [Candidatus Saccharibacteria bacterium]